MYCYIDPIANRIPHATYEEFDVQSVVYPGGIFKTVVLTIYFVHCCYGFEKEVVYVANVSTSFN
jgi:hypothetical protein